MFEPTSRYYMLETASLSVKDGNNQVRLIVFKRRRFIPPTEGSTTLVEHTVVQQDRLDNLAALYLGDPTQFWRLCDANGALHPAELTAEPGRLIRISLPKI